MPDEPVGTATATEDTPLTSPDTKDELDAFAAGLEEKPSPDGAEEVSAELPANWREHEAVVEAIKEREGQIQSAADRAHAREVRDLRLQQQQSVAQAVESAKADAVIAKAEEAKQRLFEKLEQAGASDEEISREFGRFLQGNETWGRIFLGNWQGDVDQAGFQRGMFQASALLYQNLPKEQHEELADLAQELSLQVGDGKLKREEAFPQLLAKWGDLVRADERTKMERLVAERQAEEAKAGERQNGTKPPPKLASGGHAPTQAEEDKLLLAEDTPIGTIQEIMARRQGR